MLVSTRRTLYVSVYGVRCGVVAVFQLDELAVSSEYTGVLTALLDELLGTS